VKLLIQAVDFQKCIALFKKGVASLIILSMFMIDVAKAMDEERGSTVTQRIPSQNPINPDPDNTDSDSSLKQCHSSDDGDSSPGSISSSPEKSKPGGDVGDNQSLAIIPFVKVSLVPPQLSIVPLSEQKPGETGRKPVSPTVPFHSGSDESDDEFNPLEVGSLEQNRQKLIAGLPSFEGPTGRSQTPSTVPPRLTAIVPDPSAFKGFQESYPQLQLSSSMGASPNKAGSLQDRSPSYIPSPHSIPQNHNNNGKSVVPGQSKLVFHSTGSHPLDDSDTDNDDQGTIRFHESQKSSPNPSLSDLRSGREFPLAPPAVLPQKPGPVIDDVVRALLMGDGSDSSLFPEEQDESLPTGQKASNTSPPGTSSHIHIGRDSEKSPLLGHQTLSQQYSSIQGDSPTVVVEIGEAGDDPEAHASIGDSSNCCSCCANRPCWPQHTEYTLPDAQHKLQQLSQKMALLRQTPSREGSSLVSGQSSGTLIEFKPLPNLNDYDKSGGHSGSSGGSIDGSSSSNDNSPVKRSPPLLRVVGDQANSDDEQGEFFLPANLLKDSQTSDEEDDQLPPPGSGSLSGSPHFIDSHQEEESDDPLGIVPSDLRGVFDHIAELESGLNAQNASSFRSFCQDLKSYLKSLPAKTKSQLKDYVHQVLNGKSTWPQRIGKWGFGPFVGAGFAIAMGPVYGGGTIYLKSISEFFNKYEDSTFGAFFTWYIVFSAIPDGVSRNAHLWKKGIGYLSQEKKEIGRMCVAGCVSALMSLIPLTYLINSEEYAIQQLGLHGFDNQFGFAIAILGLPLVLDAFASDFNACWDTLPEIKEFFGKLFCRKSLHFPALSLGETQREQFDSDLEKLKNFLFRAPDDVIEEIYSELKQVKDGVQVSYCETYDEDLAAQQAFAAVSYLLSLADEVVKGITKPKSIFDISFDLFKYTCLIFGAPTAMLLLQFVGTTVSGFLCLDFCSEVVTESIGGGFALIAFIPFIYVLNKFANNFKQFLIEKDPHGYGSHPNYRLTTKLYIVFQSLVYLFPPLVAILQSYQQWFGSGWWPLGPAIPVLIPRFMGYVCNFNGTFNEQVATSIINGCHKVGGKCSGETICTACKKDWLIRFIEASRGDLKHWHSDLVEKLRESIEVLKKENSSSVDEVMI
jgi:hypothetical protein